jgi:hypothetical protein
VFHSIHPFPSSVRSPPPGLIIAAPGETNEPKRCLRTRTAFLSLPAPPDCFAFAECGAGAARSPSPFACGCVVCGASESSGPAAGTTRSGLCCSWSRCVVGVGPGGSLQPASYRSLIALKVKEHYALFQHVYTERTGFCCCFLVWRGPSSISLSSCSSTLEARISVTLVAFVIWGPLLISLFLTTSKKATIVQPNLTVSTSNLDHNIGLRPLRWTIPAVQ